MNSLYSDFREHDHDSQTGNTNSDCDWDCWETGDWGDMEQQPSIGNIGTTADASPASYSPKSHEQWTSLEEKPEEEAAESRDKNEVENAWEDTEFQPFDDFQPIESHSGKICDFK